MKKYGILAALVMTFALAGCGGGEQAEVPAQEAIADTMINSGSAGGSSGFSETYELDNTNGEALHFYVRNTRPESDVYTELKVSILCDEEEVAQEVLLPGESTGTGQDTAAGGGIPSHTETRLCPVQGV